MTKGRLGFLLASVLAALLAGLLFTPGLPGEFIFDDEPNIVSNVSIQLKQLDAASLLQLAATPQVSGDMRTLPTLTFALDYWRAGGADPATFKITNIAIHVLTTVALTWLFRGLLLVAGTAPARARWTAPLLALAWATHPLQVSSVLYAVQRLQILGTFFLVLALLAYLHARKAQIEGRSGRTGLMAALLLWVVAMSCKEDSAQLPAYTLALEITLLHFAAADGSVSERWRRGYKLALVAAFALYLFVVIPHYWSWNSYDARNFSTSERLLTQARVLCLYLWQILIPLPSSMPFYYDWLQPSRGLLTPWTTLPAIAFLMGLLGGAWKLRKRMPLFSLGVFLFFSAHFITSNVVGLELAFEHRNNFALIGAVLAVGSLLARIGRKLQLRPILQVVFCTFVLAGLAGSTLARAHSWSNNTLLAEAATDAAPHSARAWIQLCASQFKLGGGITSKNKRLDQAIAACSNGATLAPYALNNTALLIVLKSLKGNISQDDWALFQRRLETVQMSWDNQRAPTILTYHFQNGVRLDKYELLKTLSILSHRVNLEPLQSAQIGYFVRDELSEPDLAMPYFLAAIRGASPLDPFPQQLFKEFVQQGRPDLAKLVEQAASAKFGKNTNASSSVR